MRKLFRPTFVVAFILIASVILFQGYSVMDASNGKAGAPKFQSIQKLEKLKQNNPEVQKAPNGSNFKVWKDGSNRIISLNETPTSHDITTLTKDQLGPDVVEYEFLTLQEGTKAIFVTYEGETTKKKIRYSEMLWSKQANEHSYYTHKMTFTSGFSKDEIIQIVNSASYGSEAIEASPDAKSNTDQMQKPAK